MQVKRDAAKISELSALSSKELGTLLVKQTKELRKVLKEKQAEDEYNEMKKIYKDILKSASIDDSISGNLVGDTVDKNIVGIRFQKKHDTIHKSCVRLRYKGIISYSLVNRSRDDTNFSLGWEVELTNFINYEGPIDEIKIDRRNEIANEITSAEKKTIITKSYEKSPVFYLNSVTNDFIITDIKFKK